MTKKCNQCAEDFTPSNVKGAYKRSKYCSRKCAMKVQNKKNRQKHNEQARQRLLNNPVEERAKRAEAARKWRAKHPDGSRKAHRKLKGTGEIGNPEDIMFYGYKEPLRKFELGFGYRGVLIYNKKLDKVQCHYCGRMFRMLNNGHLKTHGLTAKEYKQKTELAPTTALIGEGTRLKLIERPYNPNHMEELRKAQEARRERIKNGKPDKQSGHKLSLERKNERGTCPDQLLDMIDKTVKSYGRVPTEEEFLKMHNGKYLGSIRRTYGTWTNALAKLKLVPNMMKHSDEYLIGAMKNFYDVNKRTPRYSDMGRGLLPGSAAYYNRFKNMNHARLLANVPLVIRVGRHNEEWTPDELEREKMLKAI